MTNQTARRLGLWRVVAGVALLLLVLFASLKGCVVTVWTPPPPRESYGVQGGDGRMLALTFLPGHEVLASYADPTNGYRELALLSVRGQYATRYFGSLWSIGDWGPLSLRTYPSDAIVVRVDVTVLSKWTSGAGTPVFATKGSEHESLWVFREGGLDYADMHLQALPRKAGDDERIDELLRFVRK